MEGFDDDVDLGVVEELPQIEIPDLEDIFVDNDNPNITGRLREGNDRLSKSVLGKMAKAALLARRVKQLELGSQPLVNINSTRLEVIAKEELRQKVIPIKIVRRFPDGSYEIWKITDFEIIAKD